MKSKKKIILSTFTISLTEERSVVRSAISLGHFEPVTQQQTKATPPLRPDTMTFKAGIVADMMLSEDTLNKMRKRYQQFYQILISIQIQHLDKLPEDLDGLVTALQNLGGSQLAVTQLQDQMEAILAVLAERELHIWEKINANGMANANMPHQEETVNFVLSIRDVHDRIQGSLDGLEGIHQKLLGKSGEILNTMRHW